MGHKIPTGNLIKLLGAIVGLILTVLAGPAYADRGMLPIYNVSVYGPGQKAIVAWNGEKEVLILSTDVRASGKSLVLELLPLPSQPNKIEKADFAAFKQIEQLIRKHLPPPPKRLGKGVRAPAVGDGVVVVFHEKIGAHDITVVKAEDAVELSVHFPLAMEPIPFELLPQSNLKIVTRPGARSEVMVDSEIIPSATVVRTQVYGSNRLYSAYLLLDENNDEVTIEVDGIQAVTKVSPEVRLEIKNAQLLLTTTRSSVSVQWMPNEVVTVQLKRQVVEDIELKSINGKAAYQARGVAQSRLLGIVPMKMPKKTIIDATTGKVIKESKPWWGWLSVSS